MKKSIKTISLIITTFIVVTVVGSLSARANDFDAIIGDCAGNIYENQSMGFRMVLPESFEFVDDKALAEDTVDPDAYLIDGKFTVQSEDDISGLVVGEAYDKNSDDNVNITITNLNGLDISEAELADIVKEQTKATYDNMGLITDEHEVRAVEFAGGNHYEIWYSGRSDKYPDFHMYQRNLIIVKNGYAMCIAVTCGTAENAELIVKGIEPL